MKASGLFKRMAEAGCFEKGKEGLTALAHTQHAHHSAHHHQHLLNPPSLVYTLP